MSADALATTLLDARAHTHALIGDLDDDQLLGPRLDIVNPLLWELGHVAWFYEHWVLRRLRGHAAIDPAMDAWYDSAAVAHDTRWDLPLPSRQETLAYMEHVLESVLDVLPPKGEMADPELTYFCLLGVFHEDMHGEAFTYTRQTHAYAAPPIGVPATIATRREDLAEADAALPARHFLVGGQRDMPFLFDNEKWCHDVELAPFSIARTAVTQGEFLEFVEDGAYRREALWCSRGWEWKQRSEATHPLYWSRSDDGTWRHRVFATTRPLDLDHPMIHVNWYEADAYCRWRGRRLPSEAEWEAAATGPHDPDDRTLKRTFPWGETPASTNVANLDASFGGPVAVSALRAGESLSGCRQLIGNVWEWTASPFAPYPGFEVDPYKEYSVPWFGTHYVLRGGSWATRGRLIRNTWRNYYTPDRRDVFAGFRTCALR
jgi:iron(II)-dependent oxidoreductase